MKKLLAMILATLMLFGIALAQNPTVDSVLTDHDVDVEPGSPSTIFTITPGDADFTWALYRLEGEEWAPATVEKGSSTAVQGSGSAFGSVVEIAWDYWYNGDYTGYDGGVKHKLEVRVGDDVVAVVDFYVNYFMNYSYDRVSLLSWLEDEDGNLTTNQGNWYPDNTANVFGPEVEGSWQTFAAVDLSVQGEQTFDLVAAGSWKIGTVTVTVDGDTVTVDYYMTEDVNTRDEWDVINVDAEYVNIFADAASIDMNAESAFAFGEPISIANDLGGDTIVCLYIKNQVDYPDFSPYVSRFWPNAPVNKAIVEAMNALLAQ